MFGRQPAAFPAMLAAAQQVIRMNAPRSHPPTGLTVAVGLLGSLFLIALIGAAASLFECVQSLSYVETKGVITEHAVSRSSSNSIKRSERRKAERSNTQFLVILYRYQVGDTEYEGDRIQPGTFGLTSGANFRAFSERFPVGKEVTVYVDPSNPTRAVLVTGWSFVTTFLCVLGGFFGFGFWMLYLLRKHWNTPQLPTAIRR